MSEQTLLSTPAGPLHITCDPARPWLELTVALGAGMADEQPEENGLTHLWEHLTARRARTWDGRSVTDAAAEHGGSVTAHTYPLHMELTLVIPVEGSTEAGATATAVNAARAWLCPRTSAWSAEDVDAERRIIAREVQYRSLSGPTALFPWSQALSTVLADLAPGQDGFADTRRIDRADLADVEAFLSSRQDTPATVAVASPWPCEAMAERLTPALADLRRPERGVPLLHERRTAPRALVRRVPGLTRELRAEGRTLPVRPGEDPSRARARVALAARCLQLTSERGGHAVAGLFGPYQGGDWPLLVTWGPPGDHFPSDDVIAAARRAELPALHAITHSVQPTALRSRDLLFGLDATTTEHALTQVSDEEVLTTLESLIRTPAGVLTWTPDQKDRA